MPLLVILHLTRLLKLLSLLLVETTWTSEGMITVRLLLVMICRPTVCTPPPAPMVVNSVTAPTAFVAAPLEDIIVLDPVCPWDWFFFEVTAIRVPRFRSSISVESLGSVLVAVEIPLIVPPAFSAVRALIVVVVGTLLVVIVIVLVPLPRLSVFACF